MERKFFVEKFMVLNINGKNVQGYVFKNEYNHTMIIVYGEGRKKSLVDYLSKKAPVIEKW